MWSSEAINALAGLTSCAASEAPKGSQGAPIQIVINTTEPFQNLNEVVQAVLKKAQDSGKFYEKCAERAPSKVATPELAAELWKRSEEWAAAS